MELKTLKDIEGLERFDECQTYAVYRRDLKQEAIKHLKDKTCNMGFGLTPPTEDWIKNFFNIKEEDLQ